MNVIRITGTLSALAIAATFAIGPARAVSLDQAAKPRETPPASYSGDVYVDSRGCAYARANVGGATNWVPRLSANRKEVVCGLAPTFAAGNTQATRPPAPIAPPPPAEVAVAPAAVPAPRAAAVQGQSRQAAFPAGGLFGNLPTPSPAPEPSNLSANRAESAPAAAPAAGNRRLNVTCPATSGSARVRIGGATINVNCGASALQERVYSVQHSGGMVTELVVRPAPVVLAQAQAIPSYGQYRPSTTYRGVPVIPNPASSRVIVNHPTYQVYAATPDRRALTTAPRMTMHDANITSTYRVPRAGESYQAYVADKARAHAQSGIPYSYAEELQARPVPTANTAPRRQPVRPVAGAPLSNPPAGLPVPEMPAGYRPAWDDGRLNPLRGPRVAP